MARKLGMFLLLAAATLLWLVPADAAPGRSKRYGIEGKLVGYDEAARVMTVMVVSTRVSGLVGGNTVGQPAPKAIKRGEEVAFQVEPEGSVLRRTVIKSRDGGGLDNSGTVEGFRKALGMIPEDSPVVFSFEENDAVAVAAGKPSYKLRLVQIQLSDAELRERFREFLTDE